MAALECDRCGAELPPEAASGAVQCRYCGTTSVPAPRVIEKVRERVVLVPGDGSSRERTPGVACPRCGHDLVEKRTPEHVLRGCQNCGGAFLEPATVEALQRTRDEMLLGIVKHLGPLLVRSMDRRPPLDCPFCHNRLKRLDLGETGHAINTCETHGTFFDRDGVVAFADFCQERRAGEISEDDLENAGIKKGWW